VEILPLLSLISTLVAAATTLGTALTAEIPSAAAVTRTPSNIEFRLAETEPAPSLTRIEGEGRTIYLQPKVLLSTADIAGAKLGTDPFSAGPVVELTLTPEGRDRLAKVTTDNVGQMMAVTVNGALVTAPIIREPILGGQLQISGLDDSASAADLANSLGAPPVVPPHSLTDGLMKGLFGPL
jgi:preprotein translocase subunit SecD